MSFWTAAIGGEPKRAATVLITATKRVGTNLPSLVVFLGEFRGRSLNVAGSIPRPPRAKNAAFAWTGCKPPSAVRRKEASRSRWLGEKTENKNGAPITMKCLCVTGFGPYPQQFHSLLLQAGMAPPRPALGQSSIDIHTWHRQVAELLETLPEGEYAKPSSLGRMWERLASEIFLENAEAPVWGWASGVNKPLLDFWLEFDPRVHFVLLFISAEEIVVRHLEDRLFGDVSLDVLLEEWKRTSQAMLDFGRTNPQRCLMVAANDAFQAAPVVISRVADQWKLPLEFAPDTALAISESPDLVPKAIAKYLLLQDSKLIELEQEIFDSVLHFASKPEAVGIVSSMVDTEEVVASFRKLRDRSSEERKISDLESQIEGMRNSYEARLAELDLRLREEGERSAKLDRSAAALEERLAESVEQSESILLQLHEAHEQFEASVLQNGRLIEEGEKRQAELRGELHKALDQNQHLASRVDELQNMLQAVTEDARLQSDQQSKLLANLEVRLGEVVEESELLLLHLHQQQELYEELFLSSEKQRQSEQALRDKLQSDLGHTREEVKCLKEKLAEKSSYAKDLESVIELSKALEADLKAKIVALQSKLESVSEINKELEKRISGTADELNKVEMRCAGLEERNKLLGADISARQKTEAVLLADIAKLVGENEVLILKLHEVQEELEKIFLDKEKLESRNLALHNKLRVMKDRYPDYVGCVDVEVQLVSPNRATWVLRDLTIRGEDFEELSFDTVLEHGMAGVVFLRSSNKRFQFFKYWKWSGEELTLLPQGTVQKVKERALALLALSESEWKRFLGLVELLISVLIDRRSMLHERLAISQWLEGFNLLKADLDQFPEVPRFDRLILKHQQINHDYEHLWFSLENLSLYGRNVATFEFRLSCAAVEPGRFGLFPKLEFPAGVGESIFDSWFAESKDDFGEKLELRFALPDAMDLMVWHSLSEHDQKCVRAIVHNLPRWLELLEQNGSPISRPWAAWRTLVDNIQRILKLRGAGSVQEPLSTVSAVPAQEKNITERSFGAQSDALPTEARHSRNEQYGKGVSDVKPIRKSMRSKTKR